MPCLAISRQKVMLNREAQVPSLPGASVFPGLETAESVSAKGSTNHPESFSGTGSAPKDGHQPAAPPDPSSLNGFSVGLEGEGAGLGTLDTPGSATPSGRTTPAPGGLPGDLDSDSDVGINSDSDSVRDSSLSGKESSSRRSRVPQEALSSDLDVGLFKSSGVHGSAHTHGDSGAGRLATGHAELRKDT